MKVAGGGNGKDGSRKGWQRVYVSRSHHSQWASVMCITCFLTLTLTWLFFSPHPRLLAVVGHDFYPLLWRRGGVCGLKWSHIQIGSPKILNNETISLAKNLIIIHITVSHWSYCMIPLAAFRSPKTNGLVILMRLLGVQIVIKCGMNSGRKGDIPPHNIRLCVVVFNGAKCMEVKGGRTRTRYLHGVQRHVQIL